MESVKYTEFHWFCRSVLIIFFLITGQMHACTCSSLTTDSDHRKSSSITTKDALLTLFEKYGSNGTLTFEAFEHLLHSLGLGNVAYMDHGIDEHRKNDTSSFKALHVDHEHDEVKHAGAIQQHYPEVGNLMSDEYVISPSVTNQSGSAVEVSLTHKCLKPVEILGVTGFEKENLSEQDFLQLCPLLVLQLDMRTCQKAKRNDHDNDHDHEHEHSGGCGHDDHIHRAVSRSSYSQSATVWGFSFVACVIISAVGLVAVAIIPVMHKVIYNHMLQFLVALAVGSLTGDALLHLLPHALIPHNEHHSQSDTSRGGHDRHAVFCGLTALGGIYLFFIVERIVGMCSERKRNKNERRVKKLQECEASGGDASSSLHMINASMQPAIAKGASPSSESRTVGSKLSRHADPATCEEILMMVHTNKDVRKFADDAHDELHQHCDPMVKTSTWGHSGNTSSGGHNHSHFVPGSVASVAWMVIVGDGFHNFADGLAIGSAFASSLVGGLSTSVAVFCHELPHELGDFAMLLNAGMSAKQALVYNCVSSLLCVIGMVIGVLVGNIAAATTWIFAVIAGLFLYIALVDMLPEMTKMDPKKGEHPLLHFALQNSGMLVGASVMLIIALFEDQIQHAFSWTADGGFSAAITTTTSSTTSVVV